MRSGVYSRVDSPTAFVYSSGENFNLTLSGGWNSSCNGFSYDTLSILDGDGARRVMLLAQAGSGTFAVFSLSRLHFRDGMVTGDGGGLSLYGTAANGIDISVRHCTFISNVASGFGGGLSASGNGTLRINNSVFLVNEAGAASGAASLTSNDGVAYIVNNTIIGNTSALQSGGVRYAGSSPLELANNILWANSNLDLLVQVAPHNRYNNTIGALIAPPPGVVTGEISTAPEFESGLLNFDPKPGGAQFNGGDPAPPGGLALSDTQGRPRVAAGRVDIGAYESAVLFYDGFDP